MAPYADFQTRLFRAIGLDWEKYKVEPPFYSYHFDDRTPGVLPGRRGWNLNLYGSGLKSVPYPPHIVAQLMKCQEVFGAWAKRDGAPTDPSDDSDPHYDYLSRISLDDYIVEELRCDPIVSDFYTRYTIDALGGTTKQVNAHSAICFLTAEYTRSVCLSRRQCRAVRADAEVPDPSEQAGPHSAGLNRAPRR